MPGLHLHVEPHKTIFMKWIEWDVPISWQLRGLCGNYMTITGANVAVAEMPTIPIYFQGGFYQMCTIQWK